jgi:hypothetical protein
MQISYDNLLSCYVKHSERSLVHCKHLEILVILYAVSFILLLSFHFATYLYIIPTCTQISFLILVYSLQ